MVDHKGVSPIMMMIDDRWGWDKYVEQLFHAGRWSYAHTTSGVWIPDGHWCSIDLNNMPNTCPGCREIIPSYVKDVLLLMDKKSIYKK